MAFLKQYGLSLAASAFVGIVYLLILELVHWLTAYTSQQAHFFNVLTFYLIGIYANYLLQQKLVFKSGEQPLKRFYAYNFFSAITVSLLSGWLYSLDFLSKLVGPAVESVSTAVALLVISPISFLVFKLIFKESASHV